MYPVVATEFTRLSLFGGVLIGLSAVMVMGLFGNIAGIAGISKGLISPSAWHWRPRRSRLAAIVPAGPIAAPLAVLLLTGAFP